MLDHLRRRPVRLADDLLDHSCRCGRSDSSPGICMVPYLVLDVLVGVARRQIGNVKAVEKCLISLLVLVLADAQHDQPLRARAGAAS